jgi:AraC-like DNA-binding protein
VIAFLGRSSASLPNALERAGEVEPTLAIPLFVVGLLFEEAARASGREDLGLRAGEAAALEDQGELGWRVRRAPTLGAAIETLTRSASRPGSGQRWWSRTCGSEVWLHWRYAPVLRRGRIQANDCALMRTLRLIWLAAGAEWRPFEIHLDHPRPGHAEDLAALSERGVHFDRPTSAVVLPRHLLSLPLPPPRPRAAGRAGEERWASRGAPSADFAGSVRQAIAALLRLGVPALRMTADSAGMSVRSFQRRLAESGLSFAQLLAEARLEAARLMLRESDRKVIEVSVELGYTDSANFTRAFRRWSGVSPQEFRRTAADCRPDGEARP